MEIPSVGAGLLGELGLVVPVLVDVGVPEGALGLFGPEMAALLFSATSHPVVIAPAKSVPIMTRTIFIFFDLPLPNL